MNITRPVFLKTLISLNSLISLVTIVTLCREQPKMSVLLRPFLSTDFSFYVVCFRVGWVLAYTVLCSSLARELKKLLDSSDSHKTLFYKGHGKGR